MISANQLEFPDTSEVVKQFPWLFEVKKKIYVFECDVCGRVMNNDANMEPLCTGPSWTDDHHPHLMRSMN